jgi:hypothetical protein
MAEFDKVIKGGTIVDGTGLPPYKADVGIKDGKIARIGHLKSNDAKQVLDATGLIVAPGVIRSGPPQRCRPLDVFDGAERSHPLRGDEGNHAV